MRVIKWIGAIAFCCGLLVVLAIWGAVRSGPLIVDQVEKATGYKIEVAAVEVSLRRMAVTLREVEVGEPSFFVAALVEVDADPWASLVARRLTAGVTIEGGGLDISRLPPQPRAEPLRGETRVFPIDVRVDSRDFVVIGDRARRLSVEELLLSSSVAADRSGQLDLRAGGIVFQRGTDRDELTVVQTALSWDGALLRVEKVLVEGPELHFDAGPVDGGEATEGIALTRFSLRGDVDWLARMADPDTSVGGAVDVAGEVSGRFDAPRLTAVVNVGQPRWQDLDADSLRGSLALGDGMWSLREVELTDAAGTLTGEVTYVEATAAFEGAVQWRDLGLHAVAPEVPSKWHLRSSGKASVDGNLADRHAVLSGTGRIDGKEGRRFPFELEIRSRGDAADGRLSADLGPGSTLDVRVDRADWDGLVGVADLRVADLSRLMRSLAGGQSMDANGDLDLHVDFAGSLLAPRGEVRLSSQQLSIGGEPLGSVEARAKLEGSHVAVDSMVVRGAVGSVDASGLVAVDENSSNEWSLRARGLDTARIARLWSHLSGDSVPAVQGMVDLDTSASGPWRKVQLKSELHLAELGVAGGEVGRLDGNFEATGPRWSLTIGSPVGAANRLSLALTGNRLSVSSVDAEARDWPLSGLAVAELGELAGRVSGTAALVPKGAGSDGKVEIEVSDLGVGDLLLGSSELRALGDGQAWRVAGSIFDERAVLEGTLDQTNAGGYSGRIRWTDVTLPGIVFFEEELEATSSGSLAIEGATGDPGASRLRAEIDALKIAGGYRPLGVESPLIATYERGQSRLEPFVLVGGQTRLRCSGVTTTAGLQLKLAGPLELGWARLFTDGVEAASGTVDADATIAGIGGEEVALTGTLTVGGAGLEIRGLPPFENLRGTVALDGETLSTTSLRAEAGGGTVLVTGDLDISGGLALEWVARQVAAAPFADAEMVASGRGELSGPWDELRLSGEVDVDELLYARNLGYQDILPSFRRVLSPAPRPREEGEPMRLDLRLRARDGIHVDSNLAKLEARADLRLRGDLSDPTLRGTIEVIDGQVQVRGRTFEVVNGVVTFKPELGREAYLDFLAEGVVETSDLAYGVQVRVSGTTARYRIDLSSDEGLSQTDIASLIAFGKTVSQLRDEGSAEGSALSMDRLADIAGGQIGKYLAADLQGALPFDEVELRPNFSAATGQFEPQIRVGKSITRDLTAWVAQSFGVQSQTAVEVNYDLTHSLVSVLRWESQTSSQEGALGGEMRQRFEFARLPRWLSSTFSWGRGHEGLVD